MYMYGTGLSFQIYDRDQGHYAKGRSQKVLLGVTRALEPNLLGRVEEIGGGESRHEPPVGRLSTPGMVE